MLLVLSHFSFSFFFFSLPHPSYLCLSHGRFFQFCSWLMEEASSQWLSGFRSVSILPESKRLSLTESSKTDLWLRKFSFQLCLLIYDVSTLRARKGKLNEWLWIRRKNRGIAAELRILLRLLGEERWKMLRQRENQLTFISQWKRSNSIDIWEGSEVT